MRCPECQQTQKYRQHGMSCHHCQYQYVFNPKKEKISDYELTRMVERLSNHHYCFTRNQLAIEICRHLGGESVGKKLALFFFVVLVLIFWFIPWPAGIIVGIISLVVMAVLFKKIRQFLLNRLKLPQQFKFSKALDIIERYQQKHELTQLASGTAFTASGQSQAIDNKALFFAPEAILLVPRDDLVDMLVRNRFAQTNKVAVISPNGYPAHVFQACEQFLEQHPQLPVYCIHDAAEKEFNALTKLQQDPFWQRFHSRIKDLGWSRDNITRQNIRLPWLNKTQDQLVFSRQHQKQLQQGAEVMVDFPPPDAMLTILSAAVINGVLLAAAAESVEGWSIIFEYSEEYG